MSHGFGEARCQCRSHRGARRRASVAGAAFVSVRCVTLALSAGLIGILSGCSDEGGAHSIEDAYQCAKQRFGNRGGTFSLKGNSIAYSFESENGPAKVIVTFDRNLRPVSSFFASTPYGSHAVLMDADRAIQDCAAYGGRGND
jgi:hypothetical protein